MTTTAPRWGITTSAGSKTCLTCGRMYGRNEIADHERRVHLPILEVATADWLRLQGRIIRDQFARGEDPVDYLFGLLDYMADEGQDDVAEGLATLCCDVMLGQVTGSSIVGSLVRMGDEIAPAASDALR